MNTIIRTGLRLIFLSSRDVGICSELRGLLDQRLACEIVGDLDLQYRAVGRSDILVGMRMHTLMMAAQMNVPPVAIGTLPKLHEIMRDIGLSDYVVDAAPLDAAAFQDAVSRALQNSETTRAVMSERVTGLREKAALNAKILRAMLRTSALD